MPTYSIDGPDGKTHSIDGPPGATQEQVIEAIKKQQQLQAQPNATPPQQAKDPAPDAAPDATYGGEIAKGAARGPVGFGGFALGALQDIATFRGVREGAANLGRIWRGEDPKFEPTDYATPAIEKLGIEPSENATTGQAVAGSVAESLTNPMSWVGSEGLIVKALSALGAGAGSEYGRELLGPIGGIIGGAAGGTIPGAAVKSRTYHETLGDQVGPKVTDVQTLRDIEGIKTEANKGYNWLRDPANRVQVPPQAAERMFQRIMTELHNNDVDENSAPATFGMIDRLRPGNVRQIGDSRDVLGLHNRLGTITPGEKTMDDPRAAQIARGVLRSELENNLPRGANKKLKDAMANWSHYIMIKDVEKSLQTAIHRAEVSGTGKNSINTMRQEIRKILDSDSRVRGFPPEAKAGLEKAVSGSFLQNALRWLGKIAPATPLLTVVSALYNAKLGLAFAGGAGIAWGARTIGDFLTKQQIARIVTTLRQQAPANKWFMGRNRARLEEIEPYPRTGAVRGALTGATPTGEPGTDTGEALAESLGNFAQGGLYGVAKGRGYSSPAADAVASFVNSRGMNDAMVGMAIPTNVLHDLLVVQKMTYQQAADALGVTRQAVAGKAFREGLASGRQQGQQTAAGREALSKAARDSKLASRGGQANAKKVALTAEQRELEARIQRVHDAIARARPQGERPQPSLPRLKFMEGPGPEEADVSEVLENAPEVREGIPRITVHPRVPEEE